MHLWSLVECSNVGLHVIITNIMCAITCLKLADLVLHKQLDALRMHLHMKLPQLQLFLQVHRRQQFFVMCQESE